jgi:hypothetical protein
MHTWGKSGEGRSIGVSRIVSIASLVIAVVALLLAMHKPQPVAFSQAPAALAANAQSFQSKVEQLEKAQAQGQNGTEVHLTSEEISAAIAQASGSQPSAAQQGPGQVASGQSPTVVPSSGPTPTSLEPSAILGSGAVDAGTLQDPVVSFDGDQVHGQFLTEVAGKKVYLTVSGHLGAKDGYATFQPTEFKIGDLNVPVSLVNDALQKKMLEQRDRLKLPDFVSDVRVENGELVVKQK